MEETESIEEEGSMTVEDGMVAGLSRFIMTLIENAIANVKQWAYDHFTYDERIDEITGSVEEVDGRVDDLEGRIDDWDNAGHVSPEQMGEAIDAAFEDVSLEDLDGRIDRLETILRDINQVFNNYL